MKTIELTIDEDGEVEVCRRRPQPGAPQQGFNEELVSTHCEAFADHAASFLLEAGGDLF